MKEWEIQYQEFKSIIQFSQYGTVPINDGLRYPGTVAGTYLPLIYIWYKIDLYEREGFHLYRVKVGNVIAIKNKMKIFYDPNREFKKKTASKKFFGIWN